MADMVPLRNTVMLFVVLFGVVIVQMQMTSVVPLAAASRVLVEANPDAAGVKVDAKAGGNGVGVRAKVGAKAGGNGVAVRAKARAKAEGNEEEPIVGIGAGLDYDYGYGGGN